MNKLETLGLIELTSQTQANNGTRCWYDPQTNDDYLSYESGYCRKAHTFRNSTYGNHRQIYQINLTKKVPAYTLDETRVERILIPSPDARIDRIAQVVIRARKNYKNKK